MGKGVETSVVYESVMPAGALNSVALHHLFDLGVRCPSLSPTLLHFSFLVFVFSIENNAHVPAVI